MENLAENHYHMLSQESGIDDQTILTRGYRTITENQELEALGFSAAQRRATGLLVPVWSVDGSNGLYQFRPDNPRVKEKKDRRNPDGTHPNSVLKYETPAGASMKLDVHPSQRERLGDPSVPLWITEGVKKGDALASRGLCAVALLGVWNWRGANHAGGLTALPDWELIALKNRRVRIVFDNDVMRKVEVQQALKRFTAFLQGRGAYVDHVYLPAGVEKIGVDDWLAAGHTVEELEALVEAPRSMGQPAPDEVILLDEEPATMARPLVLVDGVAYAATWLHVKVTKREGLGKNGEVIRYNPPQEFHERRMFIIRSDGAIFGDGAEAGLDNLGLEIKLPEIPRGEKVWSATGVKAYAQGKRSDATDVFKQLVCVVDHFIDFDKSLSDQRTMAEMVSCYIMATWLLDAFDVIGFLWPNGERGSGKTHLLIVVTELGYLGEMITAGGTFASLRDLADYGATLAFDDAENLSDPRSTDPDKRTLLLAGNRRGVTVPLKEPTTDKKWATRYVNVFCPRLFSAIRLPDPVLASRTIIVPLIRTNDRAKDNIDPKDDSVWPVNRRVLLDDLWALALANLSKLKEYDHWVGKNAILSGRNLQPWRALLAVAAWLDQQGVSRLWERMNQLAKHYHEAERKLLEIPDLTVLIVRAVIEMARIQLDMKGVSDIWDVHIQDAKELEFTTKTITDTSVKLVNDEELEFDADKITSRRVGRVLSKLRLERFTSHGNGRGWKITVRDIRRWAQTYGISGQGAENPQERHAQPIADPQKADGGDLQKVDTGPALEVEKEGSWWKQGIL